MAEPVVDMPLRAGLIDGLPHEEYLADPALSCSGSKLLLPPSCPAAFEYRLTHPPAPKQEWDFGTVAHGEVLGTGPTVAWLSFRDYKTKAAQQAAADARAAGEVPLLDKHKPTVATMAQQLRDHDIAGPLLNADRGGRPEQSMFWTDPETGVPCRGRVDWFPEVDEFGYVTLVDYKTCESAEPARLVKVVANLRYYQQDPWYCDGVTALGLGQPRFVFIFQEKDPPHLVTVVQLDAAYLRLGRHDNLQARLTWLQCMTDGRWPSYSDDVVQLAPPRWLTYEQENRS